MVDICIINRTSRIRDARFANMIPALQARLPSFCAAWQIEVPTLSFAGLRQSPPAGSWKVWHKDKTDMSDALGYHDVENNLPFAVVGVEDDIATGNEISTTACHEIDEMLVDPYVNRMGPTIGDKQYIIETDDAVEEDGAGPFFPGADGKPIRLSNSVTPNYFIPGSPGPWDMAGMLTGPIPDQLPGGYLGWRSVRSGAWGQDVMRKLNGAYSTRSQRAFGRTWRRTQGDASLLAPHPLLLRMGMPTVKPHEDPDPQP